MDALPATVGRYEIKAFIARGGMGTLYLAQDPVLQRQVAIKLLRDADNDDLRTRFTREARAAANLRHRNIVTIFDVGDHDGQPFMAMEYIHGQTLDALVASDPPPSTVRRLQLLEDLCDGLSYAHKRGVVHRDIKPANLMVDAEGTLKILDFGIARAAAEAGMTQAGLLVGSLNYMSPEQVAGTAVDSRSDIFAVGAVMYELLTRRKAFPGAIDSGVLNRILNGEPESLATLCPHLDPAIGAIVSRALQKDPGNRYGDLQQMRNDIAQARRILEQSVLPEGDDTVHASAQSQTTRMTPTPTPSRRGPDRDEIARRRAQQIDEHLGTARQALAAGDYDGAITACEQALLLDPNEPRALDIAERARLQRDEAGARDWLERAHERLRAGDLTAASTCVREALVLVPESPDAVEVRRMIGEAKLAQERERQRTAAVQALVDRAAAAVDRGDPEDAVAAADEALALAPKHESALQLREQAQQAIADRERRQRDDEARATADDARRLFAEGQHGEALAVLEQFWPAHPTVSLAWQELSAEAARLERERQAAAAAVAAPAAFAEHEATVFAPRPLAELDRTLSATPASTLAREIDDRTVLAPPMARPAPAPPPPAPIPEPPARPSTSAARAPAAAPAVAAKPAVKPPKQVTTAAGKSAPQPRAQESARRSPVLLYGGIAALLLVGAVAFFTLGNAGSETELASSEPPAAGTSIDAASGAAADARPETTIAEPPAAPDPAPPADGGRGNTSIQPNTPTSPPPAPSRGAQPAPPPGAAESGRRGGSAAPPATPNPAARDRAAETSTPAATPPAPAAPAPAPSSGRGTEGEVSPPRVESAPSTPVVATPPANPAPPPEPNPIPSRSPNTTGSTAAAPTVAAAPVVSDQELIRRTLNAYAQGYRTLDADAVYRVYPDLRRTTNLRNSFDNVHSQEMELSVTDIAVKGDAATVRATVVQKADVKVGTDVSAKESTEFQLEKRNGNWIILQRRRAR